MHPSFLWQSTPLGSLIPEAVVPVAHNPRKDQNTSRNPTHSKVTLSHIPRPSKCSITFLVSIQSQPMTENALTSSRGSHLHTSNPPQPHHSDQHQSPSGPGNGSLDDTRNRTLEKNTSSKDKVEVVEETRYILCVYKIICQISLNPMLNFQMLLFFQINSEEKSTTDNIVLLLYISRISTQSTINNNNNNMWCVLSSSCHTLASSV